MLILCAGLLSWQAQAQLLSGYSVASGVDANKWIALSDPDTLIGGGAGDYAVSSVAPIGFAFPFGEDAYAQFSVNADGNIRLGSIPTGVVGYSMPFSNSNCNYNSPKLNPFGCDGFVADSGYICSQLVTDFLNRQIRVVEMALSTYAVASRGQLLRMQVQLYEDGSIVFVYGADSIATFPACTYQPGMCVSVTDGWVITDSAAVAFSSGSSMTNASGTWFTPGRYFEFQRPGFICGRVTGVYFSDITSSSARVSFDADSNASQWIVECASSYSALGTAQSRRYWLDTASLVLDSLQPNTSYFVSIRAVCDSVHVSQPQTGSFSTRFVADPVSGITLESLRPTAASISWSLRSNMADHRPEGYRLTLASADTLFAYDLSSSDTILSGLAPATAYRVMVASRYGSWLSDTVSLNFTTLDSACSAPILNQVSPAANQIQLSWVPGCMESQWLVEYRSAQDSLWTVADSHHVATSIVLDDLAGEHYYFVRVGSICGTDVLYDQVRVYVPTCGGVSGIRAASVDTASALLRWNMPSGSAVVEYGEAGFEHGQGTRIVVSADSLLISGLDECTPYDAYLYPICAVGDTLSSLRISFVTTCACPAVALLSATSVDHNSIDVAWLSMGDEQQWRLEYGRRGFSQGTGTMVLSSEAYYSLSGLESGTAYDIYVTPICDSLHEGHSEKLTVTTTICAYPNTFRIDDTLATGLSSEMPVNNTHNYSLCEFIVKSSELLGATVLDGLQLYYAATIPSTAKDSVEIYLFPTTLNRFDSISQFQPVIWRTDRVYAGPLNLEGGWNTIPFESSYTRRQGENLMVLFVDYSGSHEGLSYQFRTKPTYQDMSWVAYGDNVVPRIDSLNADALSISLRAYRPEMRFVVCGNECLMPTQLQAVADYESADLSWSGDTASYYISYKQVNEQEWSADTAVYGLSAHIEGLRSQSAYYFRVRRICDAQSLSDWSVGSFSTDTLPCNRPTDLQVSMITPSSVVLEWRDNGFILDQLWNVSVVGDDTSYVYSTYSNSITIAGLLEGANYSAAVRYQCSPTSWSEWSDTITFTTSSCKSVRDFAVSDVTHTSAHLSWKAGGNSTMWELVYGDMGIGEDTSIILFRLSTDIELTPYHRYHAKVRSICDDRVFSEWSEDIEFNATSVGVDEVSASQVRIYPNPTSSTANIEWNGLSGVVNVYIYDMNGRLLFHDKTAADVLKTPALPQGAYLVKVIGEDALSVHRLIVQ